VRLVDRSEIQRLLDQQGVAVAERVDRETAVKIGKLVGARYVIAGTFIDLYGDFRIDARIIDVETGEIIKVVRSDPKLRDRQDMSRAIQSVAERIMVEAKLPRCPPAPCRGEPCPPKPWRCSAGRCCIRTVATRSRRQSTTARRWRFFPSYTEASEGLRKAQSS
jgi:hypothetical protein